VVTTEAFQVPPPLQIVAGRVCVQELRTKTVGDPLVVEPFDPAASVGQVGWVGWSSSWMRAASWKSLSVSPPLAWLARS
jgi:hypothetical protein